MNGKFYSILMLALAAFTPLFAQIDYNKTSEYLNANKYWPLANHRAINFFEGTAKKDTSGFNTSLTEDASAVCHPLTGDLLFYAHNEAIFNRKHEVMLNGSGLFNCGTHFGGMKVAPYIGDSNLYYVFHYTNGQCGQLLERIFYSIIDMRLDNGYGGVVDTQKNMMIDGDSIYVREGLNVLAGSGCDMWLIASSREAKTNWQFTDNKFRAYHITENGIKKTAVISEAVMQGIAMNLQPSPDGKLLVNTPGIGEGVELLNFDANTGVFTSKYVLPIGVRAFYGGTTYDMVTSAVFSPDNSKLYIPVIDAFGANNRMGQFSLAIDHIDSITSSEKVISRNRNVKLKLYNDTIYGLRDVSDNILISQYANLNADASLVNYVDTFFIFNNKSTGQTLASEIIFPTQFIINTIDTQFCIKEWSTFSSDQDGEYYLWNNGSTEKNYTITESGTYWVQSKKRNQHCFIYTTDTFHITFLPSVDEPIISVNDSELSTQQQTSANYQWILNGTDINGATDYKYVVTENGNYQIRVRIGECSEISNVYTVNNHTSTDAIPESTIAIYPNPTQGNIQISIAEPFKAKLLDATGRTLFTTSDKQISLQSLANGIYQIQIRDLHGQIIYHTKITKQ